jgi:hypothetical protein
MNNCPIFLIYNSPFFRGEVTHFAGLVAHFRRNMHKALKLKLHIGRRIICISSISVFAILTYEEFFPYFTATKTFDYFDILASGIGSSLAMIYFYFLSNMIAKGDLIK